jgi:predicted RNA-binding protein (virulence factor B family)
LYRIDLGYVALIDQRYQGMLYHGEVFKTLRKGDRVKGFIKNIRDDGKVDLALQPQGVKAIDTGTEQILAYLASHGGSMTLTDESSPADIHAALGMSKKQFKKALGSLFRQEKISMSYAKVTLLPPKP